MRISYLHSIFFLSVIVLCYSKTKEEWKSRVIYQLLTDRYAHGDGSKPACDLSKYCGGNFKGIQNNLDYIKNMGFNAIWISPIVKNYDEIASYHGYWLSDINAINPHFGTEQEFKDLIAACHAKDIWVMVDVVYNHAGPVGTDFSKISPFNSADHYHSWCDIKQEDYDQNHVWNLENCRLAGLPDFNTENSWVVDTWVAWTKNIISKYNIDGLRIDTVRHIPKPFWPKIQSAAGVYTVGEIFNGNIDIVRDYQNYIDGVLSYPLWFSLKNVFAYGQSARQLESANTDLNKYKDKTVLGVFADNHDNARFLNVNSNWNRFKNYLAYVMTSVGIPIMYYGGEQGFAGASDPNCREPIWNNLNQNHELYKFIKTLLATRASTSYYNEEQIQRYADDDFYAFTRGKVFAAFTNKDYQVSRSITYHPYTDGTRLCNIFNPSDCVTVSNKIFQVILSNGETKILVPQ